MIPHSHSVRSLSAFLRFAASPVPWQHLYRRTFGRHHLACGPAYWALLSSATQTFDPLEFDPCGMKPIPSPSGTTWADPFCWRHGGSRWLFMEDWPQGNPCAHLSVMELGADGQPAGPPTPIIRSDTHYSYPCTFQHGGEWWMLPENSNSGRLQLYRCSGFPHQWIPDRILMQGIRYADPTVFEHDGRWWMFLTLGTGFYGVNTHLFLFHADNPVSGEWTSHPLNPVVSGFHQSRPAGRPFVSKGRLYRPSQNCFKRYGYGLRISEIKKLDTRTYKETTVREILPWSDEILGVHHLDVQGDVVLMDVHLKSSSPGTIKPW